jgi:hypothetical protein
VGRKANAPQAADFSALRGREGDSMSRAVRVQDLAHGTSGRKTPTRVPSLHDPQQPGRPPAGLLSKGQDLTLDVFRPSVRMAIRSPGAVIDRLQALRLRSIEGASAAPGSAPPCHGEPEAPCVMIPPGHRTEEP